MITLKQVNKAIKADGHYDIELVKGDGYFYFCTIGTADESWIDKGYLPSPCVMVPRLNDLTINGWRMELQNIWDEYKRLYT